MIYYTNFQSIAKYVYTLIGSEYYIMCLEENRQIKKIGKTVDILKSVLTN